MKANTHIHSINQNQVSLRLLERSSNLMNERWPHLFAGKSGLDLGSYYEYRDTSVPQ